MVQILERTYYISLFKSEERYLPRFSGYCLSLNHPFVEKYGYDTRSTPCRFGGFRNWYICEGCERNCLILYYVGNGFRCRKCSGRLYYKQTLSKSDWIFEKEIAETLINKWKHLQVTRPYYNRKLTKRASKLLTKATNVGDSLREKYS